MHLATILAVSLKRGSFVKFILTPGCRKCSHTCVIQNGRALAFKVKIPMDDYWHAMLIPMVECWHPMPNAYWWALASNAEMPIWALASIVQLYSIAWVCVFWWFFLISNKHVLHCWSSNSSMLFGWPLFLASHNYNHMIKPLMFWTRGCKTCHISMNYANENNHQGHFYFLLSKILIKSFIR